MRLHRIEVEGFGPFRERQVVDLDDFADDGIFLISGRTGAGKSSLLDAVCFALYGAVPRYEGGERRLRSDHCGPGDASEVAVELTIGERRWRVVRSPEYDRPRRRGEGTTTEPHRAQLFRQDDGEWTGVAARPVDVARELGGLLQLTQQQFLQVVLLAQNRFARFLLAKNDERQALLRTLFGTRRFEEYEKALDERRRETARALESALGAVEVALDEAERLLEDDGGGDDSDDSDGGGDAGEPSSPDEDATGLPPAADPDDPLAGVRGRRHRVEEGAARIDARAEESRARSAAAEEERRLAAEARDEGRRRRELQQRRERARAAIVAHEADAERIDRCRVELDRATALEGLRPLLSLVSEAEEALLLALSDEETARTRREEDEAASRDEPPAAGPDARDTDALAAAVEDDLREIGSWEHALAEESSLRARRDEHDELTTRLGRVERELADLDERRRTAPQRIGDLDRRSEELRVVADEAVALFERIRRREEARDAALEAERLAAELRDAERDLLAASESMRAAAADVEQLLRRRIGGMAGELAAALKPGEPCAVCGSREHPAPAVHRDAVTDGELADAERRKDDAVTRERAASEAATLLRNRHAVAQERAGGESAAVHEEALAEARTQHDRAEQARRVREELEDGRAVLLAEVAADEERHGEALVSQATLRERIRTLAEGIDAAAAVVDTARGSYDSVSARVEARRARVARTGALLDAVRAVDQAQSRARDARREQDAALAAHGTTDPAQALHGLRTAEERERLREEISSHDARLAADRAAYDELAAAGLPDEPLDLTAAENAVEAADTRWRAAVEAHSAHRHARDRLAVLRADLDDRIAAVEGVAAAQRVATALADTVAGRAPNTMRMSLETFVLAAELEEIVDAANLRLAEMSEGRYSLRHSDARAQRGASSGLGIEVLDAFTGQTRPAPSLSGGETFLASLALALGLAEVVTGRAGGIRLDTLFIDEGFGSLDAETLEVAMRTLDELRQGGRTIGLISHVEAMKEQIPAQIRVEADPRGAGRIRQ